MRVIVTGAGGFLGRSVIDRLLQDGHEAVAVDVVGCSSFEHTSSSKLTKAFFEKDDRPEKLTEILPVNEYDAMIHLAWIGSGGPLRSNYAVQLDNVKMSLDYYTVASKLKCKRFISAGTIGEKMCALADKSKIRSENFVYATCKSMTAELLKIVSAGADCKVTWATLGGLYGPGDSTSNLVNYTINTLLHGDEPTYGPGEQPFDFVHVKDCAKALCLLATTDTNSSQFYVGSGHPDMLKEFLLRIEAMVNNGKRVGIGRRPDDGTRYSWEWFDISPLSEETGYVPDYSFDKGIREILDSKKRRQ